MKILVGILIAYYMLIVYSSMKLSMKEDDSINRSADIIVSILFACNLGVLISYFIKL